MNNGKDNRKKGGQTPLPKYQERQKIPPRNRVPRKKNYAWLKILIGLILVAGAVAAVIALTTKEPDCYELSYGSVNMKNVETGVLIKDETGYTYPEGATIVSRVADGTYVNAGDVIATVRTADFNNDWCERLRIARKRTVEYLMSKIPQTDEVLYSALANIDSEIAKVSDEMLHELSYNPSKYGEYSAKLETLYDSKEKLLLERIGTDYDINEYIKPEESLKQKIAEETQNIYAVRSGVISYNTDGYANIYNVNNIESVTETVLADIIADNYTAKIKLERMECDYTISDMSTCYVVLKSVMSSFKYPQKNDEVIIDLGDGNDYYDSVISEKTECVEGWLLCIKMIGEFDSLYRTRVTEVSVEKSWNGIVIPKEHLVKNKDEIGVYVYKDKKKEFVAIDILAENENIVVVNPSKPGSELKKGTLIVKNR